MALLRALMTRRGLEGAILWQVSLPAAPARRNGPRRCRGSCRDSCRTRCTRSTRCGRLAADSIGSPRDLAHGGIASHLGRGDGAFSRLQGRVLQTEDAGADLASPRLRMMPRIMSSSRVTLTRSASAPACLKRAYHPPRDSAACRLVVSHS